MADLFTSATADIGTAATACGLLITAVIGIAVLFKGGSLVKRGVKQA